MTAKLVTLVLAADNNTITYQFTVEDPATWTQSWSGEYVIRAFEGPIYEYACHEGNYGMFNLLSAARAVEKDAAEAAKKGSN